MKKTDELRQEIITKKNEVESLQAQGNIAQAAKVAGDIENLLNKFKVEDAKEKATFENFKNDAARGNCTVIDGSGHIVKSGCKVGGVVGEEYKQNFFNQVRTKFKNASGYLREGAPSQGGYLVPAEFHNEIVTALSEENVLRQISRVVATENDRQIPIQTIPPSASFVAEGQTIPLSTEEFDRKVLGAYKIAAGVSVSNELLADSFFDIEGHLTLEFAKAIGAAEENAFLNGTGNGEPLGILPQLAADSSTTISISVQSAVPVDSELASSALITLAYSLKRPYRKNACWLMNDSTFATIRKLRDDNKNYLWQASLAAGEPPTLLGYPVFSSGFMPAMESGKIPILFGDFTRFIIGQRGEMVFKPLRELHALQDLTTFLMIERVDGVLSDMQAIRGLKIA